MLYQLSYLGEPLFINNSNILARVGVSVKDIGIFCDISRSAQLGCSTRSADYCLLPIAYCLLP